MAKMGRPSAFTTELGVDICSMIACGDDIRTVCSRLGIGISTLHQWRDKYTDFAEAYMRARHRSGEASESRIQEIMDSAKAGKLDANTARVLLDGEKWLAAKRAPRTHGDRVEIEHSGNAGGLGPVVIQILAHTPATPVAQVIDCQASRLALEE